VLSVIAVAIPIEVAFDYCTESPHPGKTILNPPFSVHAHLSKPKASCHIGFGRNRLRSQRAAPSKRNDADP
jgi:hypothetical protein